MCVGRVSVVLLGIGSAICPGLITQHTNLLLVCFYKQLFHKQRQAKVGKKKKKGKPEHYLAAELLQMENSSLSSRSNERHPKKMSKRISASVLMTLYMVNDNENEAGKQQADHNNTTLIDLGLDIGKTILNIKYVSV